MSRGLTFEQVAEGTGLSRSYVHRLEHDDTVRPSSRSLAALVRFLDLDPQEAERLTQRSLPKKSSLTGVRAKPIFDGEELSDWEVEELRRHLQLMRGTLQRGG